MTLVISYMCLIPITVCTHSLAVKCIKRQFESAGACYTYVGGLKNKTNAFGPFRGLNLILDVQESEYLPRYAENHGFVVGLMDRMLDYSSVGVGSIPGNCILLLGRGT